MPTRRSTALRTWPDEFTLSTLQLLADGLTGLMGFGVACIRLVDGDHLVATVVSGSEDAYRVLSTMTPGVNTVEADLADAEDWGAFKFISHHRVDPDAPPPGWVPDLEPVEDDDAWHPLDSLTAPLHDDRGRLIGTLSVDVPATGRRPTPAERRVMDKYAEMARQAICTAVDRQRLAEWVELADATRAVIRTASQVLTPDALIERISDDLTRCFGLTSLWARVFATETSEAWVAGAAGAEPPQLADIGNAERQAHRLWVRQQIGVAYADGRLDNLPDDEDTRRARAWAADHQASSVALVPLGAGGDCVGSLSLIRGADAEPWTEAEAAAAAEIGRDLGQMICNARAFEREKETVRRLRDLDVYRSQLIAMVSHELKNPLTATLNNVELLGGSVAGDPLAERALTNVDRATQRMVRLVEDLLLLSRMSNPQHPLRRQRVDLVPVVRDVCELTEVAAMQRDLTIQVRTSPLEPMTVMGDPTELDRLVVNLVSNALKYTPEGRSISIGLRRVGTEIELTVADEGIGIAKEEQPLLFDEFFRGRDPQVVAQPGTGLGLAIVDQILRRHGGRIEVKSDLGVGSTFRVTLPAAPADDGHSGS